MRKWQLLALLLVPQVLWLPCGHASILLKPSGQNALPLRAKTLRVEAAIEKQFATTTLTWVFQNELSERIEADFFYSAPQNSVVTGFAYWYGAEKVTARIVDKERAALIYNYITTRQRDPALIEMVGKNKFRARIFPIEPNADLKIEMKLAQVLPSNGPHAFYAFPLRDAVGQTDRLENFELQVRVRNEPDLLAVTNTLGQSMHREGDFWTMRFSQHSARPPQQARLDLRRRPRALRAALYAAPSSGRDGFFALALTSDRNVERPRLQIKGVRIYDLAPAKLPRLKAGQTAVICGRYRGNGVATIALRTANQSTLKTSATFGKRAENNNLATKLWAANRIELLSVQRNTRARVIALSKRFTLPSLFTSWLAIPNEERKRYHAEKKRADLDYAAQQMALHLARGRFSKTWRQRLNMLSREAGLNPGEVLAQQLAETSRALSFTLAREKYGARPSAQRQQKLRAEIQRLARLKARDWRGSGKPTTAADDIRAGESAWASAQLQVLARDVLSEENQVRPDAQRLSALNERLKNVAKMAQSSPQDSINGQKHEWARDEMNRLLSEIVVEAGRENTNSKRVQELASHHRALFKKYFNWPGPSTSDQIEEHLRALKIVPPRANAKPTEEMDRAEHLAQLSRLRFDFSYGSGQVGDPLILVEAPADALQVIALLPGGEIKRLVWNAQSRRWEARFDIPTYASQGDFPVTVVIVNKDGARRTLHLSFRVDQTPSPGVGAARTISDRDGAVRWRLEMKGDEDTARVAAILPWSEKIELKPSTVHQFTYFALVDVPLEHRPSSGSVTYILTDKAHNRTSITVDVSK